MGQKSDIFCCFVKKLLINIICLKFVNDLKKINERKKNLSGFFLFFCYFLRFKEEKYKNYVQSTHN